MRQCNEGMEANEDCTILGTKIAVGIQNDQMLKVTALKFTSQVSFGFGSKPRLSVDGSNLIKIVPHMERLLS